MKNNELEGHLLLQKINSIVPQHLSTETLIARILQSTGSRDEIDEAIKIVNHHAFAKNIIENSVKFSIGDFAIKTGSEQSLRGDLAGTPLTIPYPQVYIEGKLESNNLEIEKIAVIVTKIENDKGGVILIPAVKTRATGWDIRSIKFFLEGETVPSPGDVFYEVEYAAVDFKHATANSLLSLCCLELFLTFVMLMNCNNIIEKKHEIHKKINRKRVKAGKTPFFTYHTLRVKPEINNGVRNTANALLNNKRQSPRVHLRRGHYRRLLNGKMVWVNHCVVGDKSKGVVMKDYDLS